MFDFISPFTTPTISARDHRKFVHIQALNESFDLYNVILNQVHTRGFISNHTRTSSLNVYFDIRICYSQTL